jgi:carbohydrate-binding DOMON domain-containing protein
MQAGETAYIADQYARMFHTMASEVAATEVQVAATVQRNEKKNDFFSTLTEPVAVLLQSFTPAETVMIGLSIVGLVLIWKK